CGCSQILLECNHVGCTESDGMRRMLTAALDRGDSDKAILESFTSKYGPIVLAAPTMRGFDLTAWWMPALVLLAGGAAAVMVAKRWNRRISPELAAAGGRVTDGEARDDLREQ